MRYVVLILLWATSLAAGCREHGRESAAAEAADSKGVFAQAAPAGLRLVEVVSGLSQPLALISPPGQPQRLYVAEQGGRVRVIEDDQLLAQALLQLGSGFSCRPHAAVEPITLGFASGGERGLLGIAAHPQFADNRRLLLSFSDTRGDSALVELLVEADGLGVAADSCRILLRVDQDFSNHNGGDIHFGPDGMLYLALGDGGSGNDPCNRAQTLDPAALSGLPRGTGSCDGDGPFLDSGGHPDSRALLGKFLRIDVDGTTAAGSNRLCGGNPDGSAGYAIPAGNPFAGADASNACDEVWSYGWRNPWRFSFDRDSGDLWVGDVGQNAVEEIDFEAAGSPGGGDYGWRGCEGDRPANGGSCAAPRLAPLLTYDHNNGRCSIVGGYRWRGASAGMYAGRYFYADSCTSEIWIASETAGEWTSVLWSANPLTGRAYGIVSFGEGGSGELLVPEYSGGRLWRFVAPLFISGFESD